VSRQRATLFALLLPQSSCNRQISAVLLEPSAKVHVVPPAPCQYDAARFRERIAALPAWPEDGYPVDAVGSLIAEASQLCEVIAPEDAAAFWLRVALGAREMGDSALSTRAFTTLQAVDPTWTAPDDAASDVVSAAREAAPSPTLPLTPNLEWVIDGERSSALVLDRPTFAQSVNERGEVRTWVGDDALRDMILLTDDPVPPPGEHIGHEYDPPLVEVAEGLFLLGAQAFQGLFR